MKYSKQYHDCLVELWNWRKNIRGPGVRNTITGVTFTPPAQRRIQPADPAPASSGGDNGIGQYPGMIRMNVTSNQMGSSYLFATALR